jgi:hypothetical protein
MITRQDEEKTTMAEDPAFEQRVRRLCEVSVQRHWTAYGDIDWGSPHDMFDPDDGVWLPQDGDVLTDTRWFADRSPAERSALGLYLFSSHMAVGVEFERFLSEGMLQLLRRLPRTSIVSRYLYHEIIEESEHSMMFQEFLARSPFTMPAYSTGFQPGHTMPAELAAEHPELFFFCVLAVERPNDAIERAYLRGAAPLHPLLRQILRIHVNEEARHVSFAEQYLLSRVPRLSARQRRGLQVQLPFAMRTHVHSVAEIPDHLCEAFSMPEDVREEATRSDQFRSTLASAIEPIRAVARRLDLVPPRMETVWDSIVDWDLAKRIAA